MLERLRPDDTLQVRLTDPSGAGATAFLQPSTVEKQETSTIMARVQQAAIDHAKAQVKDLNDMLKPDATTI